MTKPYQKLWLLVLLLVLSASAGRAQSGPYGNEWIVPGQQYYKIQVAQNGMYRLDYQYLQQAGINGVNPQQLQLWRRGRQVAIHVGGNTATLDNSTFVEFYGQRNDGALDRGMYKNAADQTHTLYSLYTDTAAYFLTWSGTTAGKRMAQLSPAPGAPHATWLQQATRLEVGQHANVNESSLIYQPWAEAGEGFLSGLVGNRNGAPLLAGSFTIDSVQSVAATGAEPLLEVMLVGGGPYGNLTGTVSVGSGASKRAVGRFALVAYGKQLGRYAIRRSDISGGKVTVAIDVDPVAGRTVDDFLRVGYLRLTYPQTRRWPVRQSALSFRTDSSLSTPATYIFDTIPASVTGYDITDPWTVQRLNGQPTGSGAAFSIAAPAGTSRQVWLQDNTRALRPLPARRVRFRQLAAAQPNFIIISHPLLMKPSSDGTVPNPVRAYAQYRATAAGGGYDTLTVTTPQLYDQFHYGEKSPLAMRQFAQWMLANGGTKSRYLLLLGKGYLTGEQVNGRFHRQTPASQYGGSPDLVPTSTRGGSDVFFTADWPNENYLARMATGRVAAQTPDHVVNYLRKLQEHEQSGYAPWRRNILLMAGGNEAGQQQVFEGYVADYGKILSRPFFGGRVVDFVKRSTYGVGTPVEVNISPQVNAGVGIITYFGHGSTRQLDVRPQDIRVAASAYDNKGKYPVMFISGCAAGSAFTGGGSMAEDWILAANKGCVGFSSSSTFDIADNMHPLDELTYTLLATDAQWYGKPIVDVQTEVMRRLQSRLLGNMYGVPTLMSTIWQGDPALKLFSPLQPDFQTADARLQISPSVVPATAGTRFELKVGVSNPGRVTTGQLAIRVTRTFGSTTLTSNFLVRQARQDTIYSLSFTNPATGSVAGANVFQVDLDPDNLIAESDETNNRATLNYAFLTGGVTTLSPPEFAIVGSRAVRLVAQNNVPTITARDYDLEADTVQTFNSPLVQRTKVNAVMVPEWQPTLPTVAGADSVVWYWRVRLTTPQGDESADWATSSFRIINGRTQGGWSQSHPGQFRRDERAGVEVAVPGGQWSYTGTTQEATVTSTRIGPARQWETLYHTIRPSATGSYTLRLLGIDSLGATTVLNPDVASRTLSLNGISAKQYPYLQLQAVLRDDTPGRTPQLEQWLVTYQGVPEGVVRPSATLLTAAALTQQAQQTGSVTVPVTFQNVADFDFTAPLVGYIVLRSGTAGVLPRERYYPLAGAALTAHSQRTYEVKLDVRGLYGTLSGEVVLNPRRQPEQFYFNNELALPAFDVRNLDTPPVLDVAFDGRHLLNGEIVSAQPVISVQLRDLDKLRPIQNRSNFILSLTPPKATSSITVDLNAAGIEFVADSAKGTALLTYRPGNGKPLEPGIYTLEVQGKDGSGNLASSEPYRITFEVVAESSITNVFPYPNPVTSKTKFVFTLTGSTLPRNMKIQIVSLTGRVVKEILMADLGPLRIGSNITEYAWDGTDDYGDRLANGTYLYRVVLDDPENQFKQRATGAERAFKKDWGKLVLLR